MITLTQAEARYILTVSEPLLNMSLPPELAIELASRYDIIETALHSVADGTADINVDITPMPLSTVKQSLPRISGKFFVGAMKRMFDFQS